MKVLLVVGGVLLLAWGFICWCLLRAAAMQLDDDER